MSQSVLIERPTGALDDDLRATSVSDVGVELDAAATADVPPTGTVLDDRYEITGLLGQGGMGHVLSARHVVLGQRLAIKVLRREMTRDAEIVERFRREARAASAIGHTGIVAVKDFGALPSGASYYVMEHVDGIALADLLARERQLPVERAVDIVSQIADALGAAHAAGVVHRDVKPENVLLTSFHGRADHVKLLDFGIAKLDFASRLSGAHRVLGTPAYMSPEQARGQKLDHRCDVYALGILFYELLTGDVPFDDKRPLEVLRQQIHVPAPTVKLLRPDVPDDIAALIASCLEKIPDARPDSMKAIVDQLAAFVPSRVVAFAPSSPPISSPPRPALSTLSVTPIAVSTPPSAVAVPSRPTPIAMLAPRSRIPIVIGLAGLALTVIGVVALAAAGGILMREHVDEETPVAIAPVAVPTMPTPTVPAPVLAAAPPVSLAPAAPAVVAPSSIGTLPPTRSPHTHPAAHIASPEASTALAPAAPPPTAPDHPAIRVIDPWDEP